MAAGDCNEIPDRPTSRPGSRVSAPEHTSPPLGTDRVRPPDQAERVATGDAPQVEDKPRPQKPHQSGTDLRQRLDQVGTILAKGLDLAEAGVSLGVTIMSRVGVAAQQKIREGLDAATAPGAAAEGAGYRPSSTAESHSHPGTPAAEPEPRYGITNRLPLMPGSTVRISFSINNDSMTVPKKVELRLEGFTGDTHGASLDPASFTIAPAQKTIAPVDFDKFLIQGTVPDKTLADVYRGSVVVSSGSELRIPLVLVVMPI